MLNCYIHIAGFRCGLAKDGNHTVLGCQVHILVCRYGICVFVVANLNVAIVCRHVHIAGLGFHGLIYSNIAAVHSQGHIVFRNHVAFSVAASHLDVTRTFYGHVNILACIDVFPDRNIAVIGSGSHFTGHVNVPLKGYAAFIINRNRHILFRQGIARYFNITVRYVHRQVAARIQHAVLCDHDILIVLVVQRFYGDIAILGLGRAVHSDGAVRYIQVDVLLRQDRL